MTTENPNNGDGEKVFLSPEEILEINDLKVVPVWIPEWNTWVRFRTMPADVSLMFQKTIDNPATKADAWVRIFALCAVKEDGTRMFTDQQLQKLRTKSTIVFLRMQDELLAMNGFTEESRKALKNVSGEAATDASPTD